MKPLSWLAAFAFLGIGCLHAAERVVPAAPPPPPAATIPAPAAIQRALVFLERDGAGWMAGKGVPGGGGCVSCHHVGFALWSHRESERAGLSTARPGIRDLEDRALDFFQRKPSKAHTVSWSQLLLGREMSAGSEAARKTWRQVQERIVAHQEKAGHWEANGQFSGQLRPRPESDAVVTMWVLQGLGTFDDLAPPIRESRDRAWAWVRTQQSGTSTEWFLARLLVERQLGSAAAAEGFLARLLAAQQADGGWSWLARVGNPSDALTTGQSVYALRLAGLAADHAAIRGGVDYLLRTQKPDGTWIVPSQLISGKGGENLEYIYKYWGTAWATIGLARSLMGAGPALGVASGSVRLNP
jgi:hypothetical protein